jgi:hypothetical protein
MRVLFLVAAIALLILGVLGRYSGYAKEAQGELRCEGAGAVVINVGGEDYAVNGVAGGRYPPIQRALIDWIGLRVMNHHQAG